MRSDIRSSASDIITQAEWTGRSDSPALAGGLNLLSWGQHFHWADPCLPLGHRSPPPASSRWGFGPESWCQWHQRGRGEVNCAATWDDRSRPSIRSRKDRQAPEHNPTLCWQIPGLLRFPLLICKKQATKTRWSTDLVGRLRDVQTRLK